LRNLSSYVPIRDYALIGREQLAGDDSLSTIGCPSATAISRSEAAAYAIDAAPILRDKN